MKMQEDHLEDHWEAHQEEITRAKVNQEGKTQT